jgi:prepilin-type N-terminal cleavage/methylation domain-containing protein
MRTVAANADRSVARSGFTLTELMIVVTMIGVMVAASAPSFRRALERSRADVACANLRSVWSAQRLYWLESQCYTGDITLLQSTGLLDSGLNAPNSPYLYTLSLTTTGFQATAIPQQICSGRFMIDESGQVSGAVNLPGWSSPINPVSYW